MMNKRIVLSLIAIGCFFCGSFTTKSGPVSKVKTVVIDAGHGGKDPGCHGIKYKEKDIALAVALKLGKYIESNFKDVKVIYTRNTDVFVELQERAMIANRNKADLFISIHCNSASYKDKKTRKIIDNPDANGSETYVMGIKNEQGKLEVAKRENSAMLLEDNYVQKYDGFDPNSDEAYIIMSLYTDTYLEQSLNIASKIQTQYKTKAGRTDKGVKRASLWVLWRTYMPSILTEIGFLTNAEEEKFLGSEKGQDYVASSVFRAFRQYKNDLEGTGLKFNDEIENMAPFIPEPKDTAHVIERTPSDTIVSEKEKSGIEQKKEETVVGSENKKEKAKSEKEKTKKDASDSAHASQSNVLFKVQFASSPDKPIKASVFQGKGIEDVSYYTEKGVYKHTAGSFSRSEEAVKLQAEIRKKGYPDAFVIAFKDGKKIPFDAAAKIYPEADAGTAKK